MIRRNNYKDYYKTLEVHPEASPEMVKKAYRILAGRYHPDKHSEQRKGWATERFKELAEAYETLNDPIKRRQYDRDGFTEGSREKDTDNGVDEEAYFYYRSGLEDFERAMDRGIFSTLLGRRSKDLKKARKNFQRVVNIYPTSRYSEESAYHGLHAEMELHEYDEERLRQLEESFIRFFEDFSGGKWIDEIKLLFARFLYLKKISIREAKAALDDFFLTCRNSGLRTEAEILLNMLGEDTLETRT